MMAPTIISAGIAVDSSEIGEALNDVGAVAGDGGLGDGLHRPVVRAGVIFGDDHDQRRHHEPDHATEIERLTGEAHVADLHDRVHAHEPRGERPERDEGQHAGRDHALIEGAHDRLAAAKAHEIGADNRGNDAHGADRHRIDHHLHDTVAAGKVDRGKDHGGDHGDHVGLEQVGRHAGTIADIVTHVVGDGRRVARIVLGNAGFDLAHKIAAHVGALGEDAAAETGED